MATAAPPPRRRGRGDRARGRGGRRVLDLVYGPWFLNYDARYALLWAHDLANGHAPQYTADFAPTPHPLQTAFGLLALPFGDASDDVLTFATLLAFGALVYLAFALGRELFSPWVGVVAALVVLTRPAMERDALLAYQDVPFAALVVGAVLLEARRPRARRAGAGAARRRGPAAPGGLGALRPLRALDLAGPRRRAQRAVAVALAAAAPLIWAGSDWAVTGDPLHSLHGTADLAIANDRRRTVSDVPVLDRAVLRLRAARAARARRPDRPRVRVVPRPPPGGAAARGRGRDGGRVRGRPDLRAAADPPLHRHAGRPAVLFYGLAVAGWAMLPRGPARARAGWSPASSRRCCRSPTCRGTTTCSPRSSAASTATACSTATSSRRWRRPPVARRVRRLPGPHGRRPPADALRALLARRRARHGLARSRAARARWASCC